jgi:hypothetical protein
MMKLDTCSHGSIKRRVKEFPLCPQPGTLGGLGSSVRSNIVFATHRDMRHALQIQLDDAGRA